MQMVQYVVSIPQAVGAVATVEVLEAFYKMTVSIPQAVGAVATEENNYEIR